MWVVDGGGFVCVGVCVRTWDFGVAQCATQFLYGFDYILGLGYRCVCMHVYICVCLRAWVVYGVCVLA